MNDICINEEGINLVKSFESFRSKPYIDAVGIPTIGYGTTFYPNGAKVKMSDPPITEAKAYSLMMHELNDLCERMKSYITKQLTSNQFSALASFCYNVGTGKFAKSTLLRKLNVNPNDPTIADEFKKWKYGNVNGVMTVLPGLVRRRQAELTLYFKK